MRMFVHCDLYIQIYEGQSETQIGFFYLYLSASIGLDSADRMA